MERKTGVSAGQGREGGMQIARVVGAIKPSGLDALALEGDVGRPF